MRASPPEDDLHAKEAVSAVSGGEMENRNFYIGGLCPDSRSLTNGKSSIPGRVYNEQCGLEFPVGFHLSAIHPLLKA
jgi:hypothetical protein